MNVPIFAFVAWSGTGKTTLIEKLMPLLKRRGLSVGVLKHDGHDFEMDRPGKDTWRVTKAGADVTAIVSGTHAAFLENRPLSEEEAAAKMQNVDIILAEGCETGPWPKIGLVRAETRKGLKPLDGSYALVLSDESVDTSAPVLPLDDVEGLADWLEEHMYD